MKKLINLIALVMLVSVNVLTPFSYAGTENEVGNPGSNEVISEDEEVILENGVRIVENEMDIVENDQNLLSSGGDAQILVNNSPNGELFVGGADSGENLEDTPLQS